MAEPKKETVRITLPSRPEHAAAAPTVAKHDTTRIVLPARTPATPIRRLPPRITPSLSSQETESPMEGPGILPRRPPLAAPAFSSALLQPLPKSPGTETDIEPGAAVPPVPPVRDANGTTSPINRGPKNETARIGVLPCPAPTAPKTQALFIHPSGSTPAVSSVITLKPFAPGDAIPRSLAWIVFAVAAVIFLIQICNYVVS